MANYRELRFDDELWLHDAVSFAVDVCVSDCGKRREYTDLSPAVGRASGAGSRRISWSYRGWGATGAAGRGSDRTGPPGPPVTFLGGGWWARMLERGGFGGSSHVAVTDRGKRAECEPSLRAVLAQADAGAAGATVAGAGRRPTVGVAPRGWQPRLITRMMLWSSMGRLIWGLRLLWDRSRMCRRRSGPCLR